MIPGRLPDRQTGPGGPGYQFDDEINDHKIGPPGAPRDGERRTEHERLPQFFIVTTDAAPWAGTASTRSFGEVTGGIEGSSTKIENMPDAGRRSPGRGRSSSPPSSSATERRRRLGDLLQAIVLGIVQGLTEFPPDLQQRRHLRIVPAFVGLG